MTTATWPALEPGPVRDALIMMTAATDDNEVMRASQQLIEGLPPLAGAAEELLAVALTVLGNRTPSARGQLAYTRARLQVSLGKPRDALDSIELASAAFDLAQATSERARVELGRMSVLDELGRHEDAVATGEALIARLGDNPAIDPTGWLRAAARENIGVAHGLMGRHHEALASYVAARAEYERLGSEADAARLEGTIGVEYLDLGELTEAERVLRQAQRRLVALGDDVAAARVLGYLGQLGFQAGTFGPALADLDRAATTLAAHGASVELARVQHVIAMVGLSLRLTDGAAEAFSSAAAEFEAEGLAHDAARAVYGCGIALLQDGDRVGAENALSQAGEAFARLGDRPMLARTWLARTECHTDPLAAARTALALLDGLGRPADTAFAHLRLAQLEPAQAEVHVTHAAALADRVGSRHLDWMVADAQRGVAASAGDAASAARFAELALGILTTLAESAPVEVELAQLLQARPAAVEGLAGHLLELGRGEEAVATAELVRFRPEPSHAPTTRDPQLDAMFDQLLAAAGSARVDLRAQARSVERHRRGGSAAPAVRVPVVVIQRSSRGLDVLVGRGSQVRHHHGAISDTAVASLSADLAQQWRLAAIPAACSNHGAELAARTERTLARADELLGYLGDLLGPDETVAIVADGPARDLPFHAFPSLRERTVTVAPSVAAVQTVQGIARRSGHVLSVGFADDQAPAALCEARRVATIAAEARLLLDGDATWDALRRELPAAAVIHIAAHGLHRPDRPHASAFRLADRWVTANDLRQLDLHGAVLVLSSCDLGRGANQAVGRVQHGMVNAALAAGAQAIVAAAWPVHDSTAADLMTTFHTELAGGAEPASALLRARQCLARSQPHPFFWAPFQVIGCPDVRHYPPTERYTQ